MSAAEHVMLPYPKTPTATAASLSARFWFISLSASGRIVAVLRGCRSFCTAETLENCI